MGKSKFQNSGRAVEESQETHAALLSPTENLSTEKSPSEKKQGSIVVIFSAWNTMIGSAVTTLPWAYQQSGLALGLIISLSSCLISYYTCMLVVRMTGDNLDYAITMRKYYGKFI